MANLTEDQMAGTDVKALCFDLGEEVKPGSRESTFPPHNGICRDDVTQSASSRNGDDFFHLHCIQT